MFWLKVKTAARRKRRSEDTNCEGCSKGFESYRRTVVIAINSLKRLVLSNMKRVELQGLWKLRFPPPGSKLTQQSFTFKLKAEAFRAVQRRDGSYLLRSNLTEEDPEILWQRYMQLMQIEAAFRCLKSDLAVRPMYHQLEHRVEAHISVVFIPILNEI
jgi:hypothetical protein